MSIHPTLYKTDSKGKIREWHIRAEGQPVGMATIRVLHGLKYGQKVEKTTVITKGKNIGKANETSPFEQAELEAQSKWNKQIDKDYAETVQKANTKILPMLAHRYDKFAKKITFPAFVQPKLDGIRCLCNNGIMQTRKGKEITSLPHIAKQCHLHDDVFFDGELYSHTLSFQEITSIVRKQDVPVNHKEIEYHVYDLAIPHWKFENRLDEIYRISNVGNKSIDTHIKVVATYLANNESEMIDLVAQFVADGYEGGIVRNKNGLYKINGRSYDLQKIKSFDDDEFEIVDAEKDKDGGCVFVCQTEKGYSFKARPEGPIDLRRSYYDDLQFFIGKMLTVRYFGMTTTDKPVPRFPVGIIIRDYE